MEHVAVQKVKDIEAAARQWLQRLLGRKLKDEEQVTVMIFPPHAAPSGEAREVAWHRLENVLDKAAERMKDVPDEDFESAVDEAMDDVRRRKR